MCGVTEEKARRAVWMKETSEGDEKRIRDMEASLAKLSYVELS